MTPRERFRETIHFRKPDRLPWVESFYDECIVRWINEGLPADKVIVIEWEMSRGGVILLNSPTVKGFDAYSYFGCIPLRGGLVPVDMGPIPRFKQRVVRENEKYVDMITETGAIARRKKQAEYTWYAMPMFIEHPVKDRESWEEYKKRLNPLDPKRYPKDWHKDSYIEYFENYQRGPTQLSITGFYGFGAQLMGIQRFNVMFYKDPELMHDIANYWEFFTVEAIRNAVETLKDRIDMVFWWEDLAERHGPNISPKLYKEFFLPHYKRVIGFLKKNKIDRILMDSDGNINPLLDLIHEAGITGLWPLEVNSYMDAVKIRRNYGNKFFLGGNLDKRKIVSGGEEMKNEVDSKVPILKELGGYFAGMDHLVPSDMSLKRFKDYAEYLKKYLPY
jgi:uroporphyrinogen decarboxylase